MTSPTFIVCSYTCMRKRCPQEENGSCRLIHRELPFITGSFISVPFVGQDKFQMKDSNREFVLLKPENVNTYRRLFLNGMN